MHPITFIGTGLAGYTLAREFRKLDTDTPLRLVTADDGGFYSKPMLSNAFAQNKTLASLIMSSAEKMASQLGVEILSQTKITKIDIAAQQLQSGTQSLNYSRLVMALGAEQIRVPLEGDAVASVLSVNDLQEYTTFRETLGGKKRLLIMGAGLIGCEFANDLHQAGVSVSVVDPAFYPLGRLVPEAAGQVMQSALSALGVSWHFGTVVKAVNHADEAYLVTLSDGTQIMVDLVLSAVGLRPRTRLAAAAGLVVERGIVADRYLRTSAENVYALGDCAQVDGLVLPFVMPIMHAARALAKTLSDELTQLTYPPMPVVVKTPACPMVISPPASDLAGEWDVEAVGQDVKAVFYTQQRQIAGFVLTGSRIPEKMALTKALLPMPG